MDPKLCSCGRVARPCARVDGWGKQGVWVGRIILEGGGCGIRGGVGVGWVHAATHDAQAKAWISDGAVPMADVALRFGPG